MMKSCAVALVLLTAAWGVSASAEEAPKEEPKKEKLICKTQSVTGSLLRKKRTCMTEQQWAAVNAAAREGVDDFVRDSNRGAQGSSSADRGAAGL